MAKKEITVTFRTITPLWTGDAWQNNREIRPSSLIGSLRFWFETIMYFADILKKKDFDLKSGRFEKEVNRKKLREFIKKYGNNINEIIKHLIDEQKIPISSVIFGTTNWRSLIEIKKIEPIEDYCFGNNLDLPYAIGIKKDNYDIEEFRTKNDWEDKINQYPGRRFKEKLNKAKREYSFFYIPQEYFYGNFQVVFEIEEEILNSIFYPLLTFLDKYGFWGGKWNIGYGRLKVLKVKANHNQIDNWKKSDFELLDSICFPWNNLTENQTLELNSQSFEFMKVILKKDRFYCKTEENFEEKTKKLPKKFVFVEFVTNQDENINNYSSLIQSLLRKKSKIRNCLRTNNSNKEEVWKTFRHKLLGEQGEGSKILPFIHEENDELKGSFLSIAGLLNLEGESNG